MGDTPYYESRMLNFSLVHISCGISPVTSHGNSINRGMNSSIVWVDTVDWLIDWVLVDVHRVPIILETCGWVRFLWLFGGVPTCGCRCVRAKLYPVPHWAQYYSWASLLPLSYQGMIIWYHSSLKPVLYIHIYMYINIYLYFELSNYIYLQLRGGVCFNCVAMISRIVKWGH